MQTLLNVGSLKVWSLVWSRALSLIMAISYQLDIYIFQEKTVEVLDSTINYLKVGNGENSILCFPGALGTIWSDFKPQINQIDKNKFTIVAFDPPGYGLSRPPNRKFDVDFYKTDAKYAYELMKTIGINKFSLLGWSDGGISSMILAAEYPDAVEKLVIWGANAFLLPEDIEAYESIRDTKNWSAKAKEPLIKLYGEDGLQDMWTNWCDTMNEIKNKNKGNICMESLAKIKCPTLILHGDLDPMIHSEHPNYLSIHIRDST